MSYQWVSDKYGWTSANGHRCCRRVSRLSWLDIWLCFVKCENSWLWKQSVAISWQESNPPSSFSQIWPHSQRDFLQHNWTVEYGTWPWGAYFMFHISNILNFSPYMKHFRSFASNSAKWQARLTCKDLTKCANFCWWKQKHNLFSAETRRWRRSHPQVLPIEFLYACIAMYEYMQWPKCPNCASKCYVMSASCNAQLVKVFSTAESIWILELWLSFHPRSNISERIFPFFHICIYL